MIEIKVPRKKSNRMYVLALASIEHQGKRVRVTQFDRYAHVGEPRDPIVHEGEFIGWGHTNVGTTSDMVVIRPDGKHGWLRCLSSATIAKIEVL